MKDRLWLLWRLARTTIIIKRDNPHATFRQRWDEARRLQHDILVALLDVAMCRLEVLLFAEDVRRDLESLPTTAPAQHV